jgi:hypothetical protein
VFANNVRRLGGLVYDAFRLGSTTHIITGKRHAHPKLLRMLGEMGVSEADAGTVSVLCCDWLCRCLRKPQALHNEVDFLSDVSGRLRPYAWRLCKSPGTAPSTVLNALTEAAQTPVCIVVAATGVQSAAAAAAGVGGQAGLLIDDGVSDPVSLRLRGETLQRGDRQALDKLRPSSRYASVVNLAHQYASARAQAGGASTGGSSEKGELTRILRTPPVVDVSSLELASVPVTWAAPPPSSAATAAGSEAARAELRGPMQKLRNFWQLAKRYQTSYWAQPEAARKVEVDFPYPLACFSRGRVDGHLHFEHESMLGGDAVYARGVKPVRAQPRS